MVNTNPHLVTSRVRLYRNENGIEDEPISNAPKKYSSIILKEVKKPETPDKVEISQQSWNASNDAESLAPSLLPSVMENEIIK